MSIGHSIPELDHTSSRSAALRALLLEFEEALQDRYGPHVATAIGPNCSIALEAVKIGPLSAGIAAGEGIAWERHAGRLNWSWHDCVFLVQQQRGKSIVTHAGRRISLDTSDFLLVSPFGQCHFKMPGPSALLAVPLPRTCLKPIEAHLDQMVGVAIDGSRGFGRILSTTLNSLHQSQQMLDASDHDVLLRALISMLYRSWKNRQVSNLTQSPQRTARLRHWVIQNARQPVISPDRLAREYGVSRRQLYRLFAREGTTPQAWVSDIRLEIAHDILLRQAESSIAEIATAVGFHDSTTFSRAFRNRYGILPSLMRSPS